MILYNIGEVTDRTIHYFSFITLRGRRTTHAYSLFLPSFIHTRVHTHTYTHNTQHPYSSTYTHSSNYAIYSATVSFAPFSRIFANRQSRPNVLSLVTSCYSLLTDISRSSRTWSIRLAIILAFDN